MPMHHARVWLAGLLLGLCSWSWALTPEQAFKIADGDSDDRIAALNEVVGAGDAALAAYLEALLADEVRVAGGRAYVVRGGGSVVAGSGAPATLPDGTPVALGCGGHPSAQAHGLAFARAQPVIAKVLGW